MANYNPLLALISGVGQGVQAIDQRHRQDAQQLGQDEERRARQSQANLTFAKGMREAGYRPAEQIANELTTAGDQDLRSLPVSITPSGSQVKGPDGAMLALAAPPQSAANRVPSAVAAAGASLTPRQETFVDPSGASRNYVFDEDATPEGRAMRQLIAKTSLEESAAIARQRAAKAEEEAQKNAALEADAKAIVATGMTGRDGQPLTIERARAIARVKAIAPDLLAPKTIDPLSGEGVAAAADRAAKVAAAEAPYKKDPNNVKPATDAERMASGFATRMATAGQTLNSLESDPKFLQTLEGTWGAPAGSGTLPLVGNLTLSKTAQSYKQAQENWVRANLRKESGAAIGTDEMAQEIANYFPKPGDKAETIQQKAQFRKIAESNMIRSAGIAWDPGVTQLLGGQSAGYSPDNPFARKP